MPNTNSTNADIETRVKTTLQNLNLWPLPSHVVTALADRVKTEIDLGVPRIVERVVTAKKAVAILNGKGTKPAPEPVEGVRR